jgi:type VI protein secretion system component Hcp
MFPKLTLRLSLLTATLAAPAAAQVRIEAVSVAPEYYGYLQVAGIAGDVSTPPYVGWFRVDDFAIASRTPAGMLPRSELSTLTVHGAFAAATPGLLLNACARARLATVRLDVIKVGQPDTLVEQIALTDAYLLETENDGKTTSSGRLEFAFTTITWTWKRPTGDMTFTWDLARFGTNFYRHDAATQAKTIASDRGYIGFMQIAGVDGGATRPNYQGWIPVSDFGAAALRPLPATLPPGVAAPRILVNAFLGQALPGLLQRAMQGVTVPDVQLHLFRRPTDTTPTLELRLTAVVIGGVVNHAQVAGAGINMILHTGRVEWTYIHPVTQTRTRGCWDFVNNRQC